MTIRKRVLSLILCAALLICVFPMNASAASDFPTVLAEAKKGVVQLYCVGEDALFISSWTGTGFAVGEAGKDSDVFVTNWHVVAGNGDYDRDSIQIWILQENCEIDEETLEPDPSKSIVCEVLKTTTGEPDYAIIRATEPVTGYKPLKLLTGEQVLDGQTVYALGYPGIVDKASANHYGIDDITSTNGIISKHMVDTGNIQVLMHTAQISGGNSGGPLITEDGAVVGVNTYVFGENEENMNRYCAEYIDYAIEGLEALGLPYAVADQPSDGTDSTEETKPGGNESGDPNDGERNLVPLIAAGAAAIAVAVGILLIAMKKKKEREAEARRQEEARRRQAEERRRQEEERRRQEEARRRQEEEGRRQEEARRRQAEEVKAQLQLNGAATYPVRAAGCIIGRGTDCGIVLPAKAPGVSTRHCQLEFQNGQLILTDLDSTYGTYIHGKRIPARTPVALKTGSSFCLGSDAYRFTVC